MTHGRHGKGHDRSPPDDDPDGRGPEGLRGPAGAAKQRAGPAPARGRARSSPPSAAPDWPALKDQVTGWMADQLQGTAYGRRLRQTIGSGTGRVDVEAEHLLDDYWWVTATPAGPTRMTPPWPWSGSRTASTLCATGRATRPASPNRTEGGAAGITDRSPVAPPPRRPVECPGTA